MAKLFGIKKANDKNNNQFIPDMSNVPEPTVNTVTISSVPTTNVANMNNNSIVSNINQNEQYNIQNNIASNQQVPQSVPTQVAIQPPIEQAQTQVLVQQTTPSQQSVPSERIQQPTPEEVLDENVEVYDPLNNANNPIPVNPVSTEKVEEVDQFDRYLISPLECFKLFFMLMVKPGDALKECSKKCKKLRNAIFLFITFMITSLIITGIGSIISAIFVKTFNTLTESFSTTLNLSNISSYNYIDDLFVTLMICDLPVLIFSIVYYAASFINSKGLTLGSYISLSVLSLIPFTLGLNILYRIGYIFSDYLAVLLVCITLLYSLILFIVGINECIEFTSSNQKIIYNGINISLVFAIIFIIALLIYYDGILPVQFIS